MADANEKRRLHEFVCDTCAGRILRPSWCPWHTISNDEQHAICFECFVTIALDGVRAHQVIMRGDRGRPIMSKDNDQMYLQLCGQDVEQFWHCLTINGALVVLPPETEFRNW